MRVCECEYECECEEEEGGYGQTVAKEKAGSILAATQGRKHLSVITKKLYLTLILNSNSISCNNV